MIFKAMRIFTLLFAGSFFTLFSFGQLSVSSGQGKIYDDFGGADFYVAMFNNITVSSEIKYTGIETDIEWYKYDDSFVSNQVYFSPESATGYYLKNTLTDAKMLSVWVVDYNDYLPMFTSLAVDESAENRCEKTKLLLTADNIAPLTYKTSATSTERAIYRAYTITYNSLEWNEQWQPIEKKQTVDAEDVIFEISESPLCNTQFTLTADDEYSIALGITPSEISTNEYSAVAVACKATTVTSTRSEKNEDERPETAEKLSGSAPLDILFKTNPTDAVSYYKWSIHKNGELLITRTMEEFRHTFSEAGKYKVLITVSNTSCSARDSITVDVSESALWIPNAFSPNGDGANDEFRVAYRSLASFECTVYNRWGRRVYSSNDPSKGWDGTIGGKPAAAAPYFYVVNAVGTDGRKYSRKGDINLLR